MRADEVHGLGKLAGRALSGGTRRISELHSAISQRVFRSVAYGVGPPAAPVGVVHDGIAGVLGAGRVGSASTRRHSGPAGAPSLPALPAG